MINKKMFKENLCIFSFDLSGDDSNGWFLRKAKHGNIDLEISFAKPLGQATTVVVFASYDACLTFNKSKGIVCYPDL